MTAYYLDSSALVKRYLTEVGSVWVDSITDPAAGHRILVTEIALVEVAAALAARHRAPRGISRPTRDRALTLFRRHFATEYEVTTITRPLLDQAVDLTQRHRLRGYDAVQLATALAVESSLVMAGCPA